MNNLLPRRVALVAAIGISAFGLTACSAGPCASWEAAQAKADAEGAYFKYEDEINRNKDMCLAQGGVD